MNLDQLPGEIILQVVQHLSTLSSVASVSQVNRKLHDLVSNNRNPIFQAFVQKQFPTIASRAPWQDAAFDLTSRSRAWDRRAFIARECAPPKDQPSQPPQHFRNQHIGFMPVIDSYQTSAYEDGREVLAWGAAGRLRLRTVKGKSVKWSSWSIPDDASPQTDILDLRLLRPHQNRNTFGESVFIRRANRGLELVNAMPEKDNWVPVHKYLVKADSMVDCVDMNEATEPLLVVCDKEYLQLFPVHSSLEQSRAEKVIPIAKTTTIKQRKRCAKFMSESRIAVAGQNLEGLQQAPIEVFDIGTERLTSTPLNPVESLSVTKSSSTSLPGRIGANVLAKVDSRISENSSDSELLLSGWSDGLVRLYDLRSGQGAIREFADPVDDGQIFSLLPIGQERFLAGSHQNACLKVFDMRMNARVYDYREVASSVAQNVTSSPAAPLSQTSLPLPSLSREINIFLALTVHHGAQPWRPLPGRQNNARLPRYRGSIYSLSSPSPSSRTVYAGIENHVIQLDFINTDDWTVNRGGVQDQLDERPILNLSCYERPRRGRESTDTVLLRKQTDLEQWSRNTKDVEPGWDERWQLDQRRTRRGMAASWWSGRA